MAKVKAKTVKEVKKDVLAVNDDDLQALLAQSEKLQEKEIADDGVQMQYILLAKDGSKALKRSNKELYIAGLSIGDFYVQKEKINLGEKIKVVPLSFVTVYNECDFDGLNNKFFGKWTSEQAKQYPLQKGSYFNRQLPNGNVLVPSHWVIVDVLGHDELDKAVVAYKKTGSRIFKEWKEDANGRSGSSATLVYELEEVSVKNDKNEWTDIGFTFVGSLLEKDKAQAVKSLTKSNKIRQMFQEGTFIPERSIGTNASPALIEDMGSESVEEDEDVSDIPF